MNLKTTTSTTSTPSHFECSICNDEEGYIGDILDEDGNPIYDVVKDLQGNELSRTKRQGWVVCKCYETKRIQRLFKSSKITDEMHKKGFKNFSVHNRPNSVVQARDKALAYYKNFNDIRHTRKNSIALLGKPGCGKTHLLMAVANTLLHYGTAVVYFSWIDGFNDLKDNLDRLNEMVYRLQTTEVLFIDDLFKGRGKPTDFQLEQLFAIVNYRYLNNLPILVSSEMSTDKMCDIDEAIGSRIHEMCKEYLVVLEGGKELNYRLQEDAS